MYDASIRTQQVRRRLFRSRRSLGLLMVLACLSQSCGNAGPEHPKPGLVAGQKIGITATAGLISLDIQSAPLGAVLTELGQRTQITFTIPEAMKAELMTVSLYQRPVDEVVQQVLKGKPYSIQYRQDGDKQIMAGVSLLVPPGQPMSQASSGGQSSRSTSTSQPSSLEAASREAKGTAVRVDLELLSLEQTLRESPDPKTRIAALNGIAARETNDPISSIVVQALSDRAPEVREAALDVLRSSSDVVPIQSLASVATHDTNPAFRIGAMSLLVDQLGKEEGPSEEDRNMVRATLQQGLADSDPRVREQASMLLELY